MKHTNGGVGKTQFLLLRQMVHIITTGLLQGAVHIKTANKSTDGGASNNIFHMRENFILYIRTSSAGT